MSESASLSFRGIRSSMAWVALSALALVLLGLVMQISVASPLSEEAFQRPLRQGLYIVASSGLALAAAMVGYHRAVRWSRQLLWLTWGLLAVLLLPGMPTSGGATRWIALGPIHVQPSEMAKLTLILFFTGFATSRESRLREFSGGFLPALFYMGITAALVRFEPDLGQALFLLALAASVLMVNGLRLTHFLPVLALGGPLLLMASASGYVQERLEGFMAGGAYQVRQALLFFAAGGLRGVGTEEAQAHLFVPEIHNDFVLVAVAEQFGLLGSGAVIALYLLLFLHGLRLAFRAPDREGFSVAFGISLMIALQAAVNIAVVTGTVPPKGISLPFVSYGGSSLLVLGAALGLLISVARAATGSPAPAARLLARSGQP